jgi:hypothetical protein
VTLINGIVVLFIAAKSVIQSGYLGVIKEKDTIMPGQEKPKEEAAQ